MGRAASLGREAPRTPPRVLIVDDSAVARAVLTRMVRETGGFEVVGAVPDVERALGHLASATVDAILLDLEMPGTDGLTGLPRLLDAGRGAKVLIVSSSCPDGAETTVRALALGAADTLVKPGSGVTGGRFAEALTDRLSRLTERRGEPVVPPRAGVAPAPTIEIVAVGASTGGIHAMIGLLDELSPAFDRPILVTQHLPSSFVSYFAAQLALASGRRCEVACDGMAIEPGRLLVAPGDAHLTVVMQSGRPVVRLSREPVANGNMPSVDPMFASLAAIYGSRLIGVVLSGMGRDGLAGAQRVHEAGGRIVVQDQASSVVWGMPGAVAQAGLAHAVLTPGEIGTFLGSGGA